MTPKQKSIRYARRFKGGIHGVKGSMYQAKKASTQRRLKAERIAREKRLLKRAHFRVNPSGVRIVHNRLLGGWYIVRGPHQTPLGGRFNSRAEAEQHLRDQKAMRDARFSSRERLRSGATYFQPSLNAPRKCGHCGLSILDHEGIENFCPVTRRNPARKYRGNRPFAIREIFSAAERGTVIVKANNGMRVLVNAKDTGGAMPKLGEDIRNYDMCRPNRGGVIGPSGEEPGDEMPGGGTWGKRNPARSREIVTIRGKRSGRIFAYATPDTPRAELSRNALMLANTHLEPMKIDRVKVNWEGSRTFPAPVKNYLANPAPRSEGIKRAARRFSRFTGHAAERVQMMPFPAKPRAGLAVGPVLMLAYRATRDGKAENYAHKFAPHARPVLVASDDGKALHLIGGRYTFTERGIVDKRK